MSPLVVGPFLALVGIVAAYFVLRRKAKTRKSMYRTLREQRERDLRKARDRATAAKAATQGVAAAPASAPIEPAVTAAIPTQEPATEFIPPAPAYVPQTPTYSPPEPPPPIEQAPVEPQPAEILPEPPPQAGSKPAWEIVQPDKPEAEAIHASAASGAGAGKASWELDPREQQRINERHKGTGRFGEEAEEDDLGAESLPQVLLSYAGLIAALLVILLGILFMIGARA